jgi:hypothetical protein
MGFAENFEVLQIRQRLLAHWSNPSPPYQPRFLTTQTRIEEALGLESSEEELDETFRKRNFSLQAVARKSPSPRLHRMK